jgi:CheY-like chemotaxis protein
LEERTDGFVGHRILLIDENRDVATLIEKFLLRKGFAVTAYIDPRLAIAHFSSDQAYDLVLSDIRMPELDGFGVVRRIKKINPKMKVLLMTSSYEREWHQSLEESGADGIIEKPPRLAFIVDEVEQFIIAADNDAAGVVKIASGSSNLITGARLRCKCRCP